MERVIVSLSISGKEGASENFPKIAVLKGASPQ